MKLLQRILVKTPIVAAATTALLIVGTTAAFATTVNTKQAQSTSVTPTLNGNCEVVQESGYAGGGAVACFVAQGDHFYLKDQAADGHGVKVEAVAQWDTSIWFVCEDHLGVAGGWTECSWPNKIKEDANLLWHAGVWEGDQLIAIGDDKVSHTS